MNFTINGQFVGAEVDLRTSLLDLLRDHLNLTGTKKGCNQGACGACTVLVDGERIISCLALAVQYQGREITTIEGLGRRRLSTRCRRRSSSMTACSAATVRRGRSARPWAWRGSGSAAFPACSRPTSPPNAPSSTTAKCASG